MPSVKIAPTFPGATPKPSGAMTPGAPVAAPAGCRLHDVSEARANALWRVAGDVGVCCCCGGPVPRRAGYVAPYCGPCSEGLTADEQEGRAVAGWPVAA